MSKERVSRAKHWCESVTIIWKCDRQTDAGQVPICAAILKTRPRWTDSASWTAGRRIGGSSPGGSTMRLCTSNEKEAKDARIDIFLRLLSVQIQVGLTWCDCQKDELSVSMLTALAIARGSSLQLHGWTNQPTSTVSAKHDKKVKQGTLSVHAIDRVAI